MKKIISLSAITILAAWALAGCDQNTPGSSTVAPATNSSPGGGGGTTGGTTNQPPTNSLPDVHTNMASLNQ